MYIEWVSLATEYWADVNLFCQIQESSWWKLKLPLDESVLMGQLNESFVFLQCLYHYFCPSHQFNMLLKLQKSLNKNNLILSKDSHKRNDSKAIMYQTIVVIRNPCKAQKKVYQNQN